MNPPVASWIGAPPDRRRRNQGGTKAPHPPRCPRRPARGFARARWPTSPARYGKGVTDTASGRSEAESAADAGADAAARPARRRARGHRRPRGAGRGRAAVRAGERPGRGRRRTRLGLPLRPARLPGAAAARGRRHGPDRPGRAAPTCTTRRSARGRRVGAARREPGPALPGRDRHAPAAPVRHRARRPARRLPRVGLAPMVEDLLGYTWPRTTRRSTGRPGRCPSRGCATPRSTSRSWSTCATRSPNSCEEQGKLDWAQQEFEAVRTAPPAAPRADPWRRTSGMHRVRSRASWRSSARCGRAGTRLARRRDISPGRVLPDAAIVEAATRPAEERARPARAARLPRPDPPADAVGTCWQPSKPPWPCRTANCRHHPPRTDAPPPAQAWERSDPAAAARLAAARPAVTATRRRAPRCPPRTSSPPDAAAPGLLVARRQTSTTRRSPLPARPAAPGRGRSSSPPTSSAPRCAAPPCTRSDTPADPVRTARQAAGAGTELGYSRVAWRQSTCHRRHEECHRAPHRPRRRLRRRRPHPVRQGRAPRACTPRPGPTTWSSSVIRELLRRHPELPAERIDDVAIAATTQIGDQGLTIGRTAALLAGLPNTSPATRSTGCAPAR